MLCYPNQPIYYYNMTATNPADARPRPLRGRPTQILRQTPNQTRPNQPTDYSNTPATFLPADTKQPRMQHTPQARAIALSADGRLSPLHALGAGAASGSLAALVTILVYYSKRGLT